MPTLHWIGKEKVVNHHRDVPFRVLEKESIESIEKNILYMMVFDQKEVKGAYSFDKAKALIREM